MSKCPKQAVGFLAWLSEALADQFMADDRRAATGRSRTHATVMLSRSDRTRVQTLLAWLTRGGHVPGGSFSVLPQKRRTRRAHRAPGARARGYCVACGRDVAINAHGKAARHRGSEACLYGDPQDVALVPPRGVSDDRPQRGTAVSRDSSSGR